MTRSTATSRVDAHQRRITRALLAAWWSNLAIWGALLVLLFASLGVAYAPLGIWTLPIGLLIAFIKAALVAWWFMQLGRASRLIQLTAATAFVFIASLFTFTFSDLFTRL